MVLVSYSVLARREDATYIHLHGVQRQGLSRKVLYSSQKAQFPVELQHNKSLCSGRDQDSEWGGDSVVFW